MTQVEVAQNLYGIFKTIESVTGNRPVLTKSGLENTIVIPTKEETDAVFMQLLENQFDKVKMNLDPYNWEIILNWNDKVARYKNPFYSFKVRDKEIKIATHTESLSHSQIPKISLPKYQAWGDI